MILFGDFHQFPPVGNPSAALYDSRTNSERSNIGWSLYRQFTTVVTLVKQNRVQDEGWNALLNCLWVGACTAEDLRELDELVLKPDEGLNFSTAPWSEAILVTSHHRPKDQWNQAALRRHCCISGQRLYTCPAEDTAGRSRVELTMEEKVTVASMHACMQSKLQGWITRYK